MKTRSLFAAALMIGTAAGFGQSSAGSGANFGTARPGGNPGAGAASGPVVSPASEDDASRTAVLMRGGMVYVVKSGKELRIEEEIRLGQGMSIDPQGKVTLKNGHITELKDGQMITPNGEIAEAPRK
jgi:hypothetical protein